MYVPGCHICLPTSSILFLYPLEDDRFRFTSLSAGIGVFWCSAFYVRVAQRSFQFARQGWGVPGRYDHSHEMTHGEALFFTTLASSTTGATHVVLYSMDRSASRVHNERGDSLVFGCWEGEQDDKRGDRVGI